MSTRSYHVTPEKAVAAADELKAATGIVIDPTQANGSAIIHGVHLSWKNSVGVLTVTLESKPFYVPESAVWEPLDKAFAA